jgi:hypothetical protein
LSGIARAKHKAPAETQKAVDIRFKAVKKAIQEEGIRVEHVRTDVMPADMFTKALPKPALTLKRSLCGLAC